MNDWAWETLPKEIQARMLQLLVQAGHYSRQIADYHNSWDDFQAGRAFYVLAYLDGRYSRASFRIFGEQQAADQALLMNAKAMALNIKTRYTVVTEDDIEHYTDPFLNLIREANLGEV